MIGIGEASRRTGLSIDTLRYYEREGLTPERVGRDASGRRVYSDDDLEWLHTASRLRLTGMPIGEVRRYAALVRDGDDTLTERIRMFREHESAVVAQVRELEEALDLVRAKIATYETELSH